MQNKKLKLAGILSAGLVALCGNLRTSQAQSNANAPIDKTPRPVVADDLGALSLEDLMNIKVTSVGKTEQRIADAPSAVTVITQDDIQRSGLREIPEILRLAPGIFVQRGNQFTGWSVSSRGFADLFANKLLVLQDGRTLYTPIFSGVYWNTVDYPTADLERIEVIRGPGATLWGSNAVNGVINITTKSARDTQGVLVDSRVGTNSSDLAVRYGGMIDDDTFYRIYAKGRAFDDFDFAPNPAGEASQWQDSRGGFRIDRYATAADTLTLQGDGFYQIASNNIVTGAVVPGYSHDYRSGENLLGRWTHVVSDKSDYSLQAYFDRVSQRDAFVDYQANTFDLDFQHRFELAPGHQIIYGLGARGIAYNVGTEVLSQPVVDPASRNTYVLSAFVQDTIALVPDRLHLMLGSKFECNSFTGLEVQPSARLLWTPEVNTSVWAGISRAVRTPSQLEEDNSFHLVIPIGPGQTVETAGTSDKPDSEEMVAYELGLRHEFGRTLSIDVTGFANFYDRLITEQNQQPQFVQTPTPHLVLPIVETNGQSAETYGLEVAAKWQAAENLRFSAAYSLLAATVHDDKPNLNPSGRAIEDSAPRNQFQLHTYLDVTRYLDVNTSLYYVEGIGGENVRANPGANPPSYARLDLGLNWHPKPGLELSVGIQNALDFHHLEAPFSGDASAEVDRALYGQLTWRF